ncbi:hypothetical protein B0A50_00473 [Salinomyces thailandicus]|uniref:Uncharacterized protein n=1 Tax=Salinomyces thailandicus TaxID=706561 RepID=A0A4U0UED9_9PEZI|nr:hypothetical protein B0A50_00473 [Salinomyces thailandica]
MDHRFSLATGPKEDQEPKPTNETGLGVTGLESAPPSTDEPQQPAEGQEGRIRDEEGIEWEDFDQDNSAEIAAAEGREDQVTDETPSTQEDNQGQFDRTRSASLSSYFSDSSSDEEGEGTEQAGKSDANRTIYDQNTPFTVQDRLRAEAAKGFIYERRPRSPVYAADEDTVAPYKSELFWLQNYGPRKSAEKKAEKQEQKKQRKKAKKAGERGPDGRFVSRPSTLRRVKSVDDVSPETSPTDDATNTAQKAAISEQDDEGKAANQTEDVLQYYQSPSGDDWAARDDDDEGEDQELQESLREFTRRTSDLSEAAAAAAETTASESAPAEEGEQIEPAATTLDDDESSDPPAGVSQSTPTLPDTDAEATEDQGDADKPAAQESDSQEEDAEQQDPTSPTHSDDSFESTTGMSQSEGMNASINYEATVGSDLAKQRALFKFQFGEVVPEVSRIKSNPQEQIELMKSKVHLYRNKRDEAQTRLTWQNRQLADSIERYNQACEYAAGLQAEKEKLKGDFAEQFRGAKAMITRQQQASRAEIEQWKSFAESNSALAESERERREIPLSFSNVVTTFDQAGQNGEAATASFVDAPGITDRSTQANFPSMVSSGTQSEAVDAGVGPLEATDRSIQTDTPLMVRSGTQSETVDGGDGRATQTVNPINLFRTVDRGSQTPNPRAAFWIVDHGTQTHDSYTSMTQLQEQLDECHAHGERLMTDVNDLTHEKERLTQRKDELQEALARYVNDLGASRDDIAGLENRLAQLSRRIYALERELERAREGCKDHIARLNQRIRDLETQLEKARAELGTTRQDDADCQKSLAQLKSRIRDLETELEAAKAPKHADTTEPTNFAPCELDGETGKCMHIPTLNWARRCILDLEAQGAKLATDNEDSTSRSREQEATSQVSSAPSSTYSSPTGSPPLASPSPAVHHFGHHDDTSHHDITAAHHHPAHPAETRPARWINREAMIKNSIAYRDQLRARQEQRTYERETRAQEWELRKKAYGKLCGWESISYVDKRERMASLRALAYA